MSTSPVTPSLQVSLDQYLALRRALGVKLPILSVRSHERLAQTGRVHMCDMKSRK